LHEETNARGFRGRTRVSFLKIWGLTGERKLGPGNVAQPQKTCTGVKDTKNESLKKTREGSNVKEQWGKKNSEETSTGRPERKRARPTTLKAGKVCWGVVSN